MKEQKVVPRFANLQYAVLHQLEITIPEYWYLDMVYYLSRDGWCHKSLENIAHDMRMTKNGVVKMRDRLIHRKLLIKSLKGYVKTSVTYNSVYLADSKAYNSVTKRTTEYNGNVQLSGTKNNNRITEEKETKLLNKNGTLSLAGMEARIRGRVA